MWFCIYRFYPEAGIPDMNPRTHIGNESKISQGYWFAYVVMVIYLAVVVWVCFRQVGIVDREFRRRLQNQVAYIARTINPERAERLLFTPDDKDNPIYKRMSGQFADYLQVAGNRGIYTIAERDGQLVFGPESYAETDPQASPPGTVYRQPTSRLLAHFESRTGFVEGPYRDEYGTFISAYAPVRHHATGTFLMMVGMDAEATTWRDVIRTTWIHTISKAFAVSVILLGGALILLHRSRMAPKWKYFLRYGEIYYTALAGLLMTIVVTGILHDEAIRSRRSVFQELSSAHVENIIKSFHDLRDHKLDSIARFCKYSTVIESGEFKGFTSRLLEDRSIESILWVPVIHDSDRNAVTEWMHTQKYPDFHIWGRSTNNQDNTDSVRSGCYPILYAEPFDQLKPLQGLDLGNDAFFRDLFQQARETGFQYSIIGNHQTPLWRGETNLQIVVPVLRDEENKQREKGYLVASVSIKQYFENTFPSDEFFMGSDSIGLYHLDKTKKPELVFSLFPEQYQSKHDLEEHNTGLAAVYPLFIFSKTYALFVKPSSWFVQMNPLREGWISGLMGLFITAMGTVFVAFIVRHRTSLENEIQKRTRELIERERLLQATLHSIGDGVICTDRFGRVTNINLVAEALTGWTNAEVHGKPIADVFRIINNHSGDPAANPVNRVLSNGEMCSLENNIALVSKKGIVSQIADSCAPILGMHNNVEGTVLVFRDVTADYAKREELLRINKAIESTGDAVAIADSNFKHFYQNPSFTKMFGYTLDEFKKVSKEIIFYDNNQARSISKTLLTDDSWSGEVDMLNKNNERFTVFLRVDSVKDEDGRNIAFVSLFKDVTEKKRYEKEILKTREQYMLAANGSNDGMWDWDLTTNALFLSPKWKQMIGYGDVELPNAFETFDKHLHPDDKPGVMKLIDDYLNGNAQVYSTEFRFRHKDGSYRWILARGEALRDETGKAYRMAGSHTDITERKQTEEILRETNRKLEQAIIHAREMADQAARANAAKSEFLANVSHEIRTPMSGVIGMARMLLDTNLTTDQRHFAELTFSSAKALLTIIDDILDFSKIEAGKMILENMDFSVRLVVENVTDFLAVKAEEKGLDIVSMVDEAIPEPLLGDPGRLRQILINLGSNAIKFTRSGHITIRAEKENETATCVTVKFSIQDTGIGISPDTHARLFQPFTQGDGSASRKHGGTGLGLAISRQLVEAMKGTIGFNSEENKGSEFFFNIEFSKLPETGSTRERDTFSFEPGIRIMVIENSEAIRSQLGYFACSRQIQVTECTNGGDALTILKSPSARNTPFNAIIIGRHLPDMSAQMFAEQAENILAETKPPLIMLISMKPAANGYTHLSPAFTGILKKPVKKREFLSMLEDIVFPEKTRRAAQDTTADIQNATLNGHMDVKEMRVLLVEDHPVNQLVIQKMLEKMACRTVTVANGREALDILKTNTFDIVLMDCQMPEMDGFEASKCIRDPETGVCRPDIPIVALTAHAGPEDRQKCLASGMTDYLSKPVNLEQLAEILRKYCNDSG
jgi:PAS domain S-box-containing protein